MDIKTSHAIQDQQYFTIYTHMLLCVSSPWGEYGYQSLSVWVLSKGKSQLLRFNTMT